ncbi:unnamed protein product [Prunus armeniaca]
MEGTKRAGTRTAAYCFPLLERPPFTPPLCLPPLRFEICALRSSPSFLSRLLLQLGFRNSDPLPVCACFYESETLSFCKLYAAFLADFGVVFLTLLYISS